MTLLYNERGFLDHETGHHPECSERLHVITDMLSKTGLDRLCKSPIFEPIDKRRLKRVHSSHYIDQVWALTKSGGGHFGSDTVISPGSYDAALLAAGSVCDAVTRVVQGEDKTALCLVRPPGHHALASQAMGFCIFNNIAIGAKVATDELRLNRVLIVDWDIHHGNGTQATFWEDPRVGFLSIHRSPFYPGTGGADETGHGGGLGYTLNLPIEYGTSRRDYLEAFVTQLERFADKIKPELVLISAGFDAHREDPVGNLGLETEDFIPLTKAVLQVAATHASGRVVSVLEGGYNLHVLPEAVRLHLEEIHSFHKKF